MGCVISCGLKLVLQILNTVLCVAFLAVAVFGILLKFSRFMVQQLLSKIFDQFNVSDEDLRQLARFITENADGIAIILVVVGLALAALCLIGCIASCCEHNALLKIMGPTCCGMDGYGDFVKLGKQPPVQCCNMTASPCDPQAAQTVNMPGCRDKIVNFAASSMKSLLFVSICAILSQAALIMIVILLICSSTNGGGKRTSK
ncbi:hypothetical protein EGR_03663 [Echinococcus granulosus]|uniref:Tetraspanin n=1 Tax=Echinococcus granulosus TaxID=6210 RepID=W6V5K6_ECHGR|nr:hypothetical protein EGR_03663 [Echinococcus granulosus]EUB61599.1 hypothetical protein EGR_03663 [Echinococcus granulosus]